MTIKDQISRMQSVGKNKQIMQNVKEHNMWGKMWKLLGCFHREMSNQLIENAFIHKKSRKIGKINIYAKSGTLLLLLFYRYTVVQNGNNYKKKRL